MQFRYIRTTAIRVFPVANVESGKQVQRVLEPAGDEVLHALGVISEGQVDLHTDTGTDNPVKRRVDRETDFPVEFHHQRRQVIGDEDNRFPKQRTQDGFGILQEREIEAPAFIGIEVTAEEAGSRLALGGTACTAKGTGDEIACGTEEFDDLSGVVAGIRKSVGEFRQERARIRIKGVGKVEGGIRQIALEGRGIEQAAADQNKLVRDLDLD